ncbi:MAG TPA: hypothetical protein VF678_12240, partial [bacterium]
MATGYEQVRSVVAEIAGDREAARQVHLVLPETGVCSTGPVGDASEAAGGCCTSAVPRAGAATVAPAPAVLKPLPSAKVQAGCCGGPAPAATDACCVKDAAAKAEGKSGCGCG